MVKAKNNPRDEWATPPHIVDALGPFDLDACAYKYNAKAPKYYTPTEDGLSQEWFGRVWCNPPYSEIAKWANKAIESRLTAKHITLLLPARTDQQWLVDLWYKGFHVELYRGRIQFDPPPGIKASSNREPSMLLRWWHEVGDRLLVFRSSRTGEVIYG